MLQGSGGGCGLEAAAGPVTGIRAEPPIVTDEAVRRQPNARVVDDEATGRLRFMGHPDLLANLDKIYRLSAPINATSAPSRGLKEQLPIELKLGELVDVRLEVGDDIRARFELGELWRCELRVLLQHLTYQDQVRLTWNEQEIPARAWRKADWTYQLRPRPEYAVDGYRLHMDLKQLEQLPRTGVNTLQVEVLEKDEQLIQFDAALDGVCQVDGLRGVFQGTSSEMATTDIRSAGRRRR